MNTFSTSFRAGLGLFVATVLPVMAAEEIRYRIVRIEAPSTDVLSLDGIHGAGINNRGDIVGPYAGWAVDGSRWRQRPFYYSDSTGTVEIEIPLEWDGGTGDINDAGQIVINIMDTETRPGQDWAFRFTPGVGLEFLEGFGGKTTEAKAINALGQVAGFSDVPGIDPFAYRYTDGEGMTNLGGLIGEGSTGRAINDQGWVAGGSAERAFLFRNDVGIIDLGPGIAYGINNLGAVVGRAFLSEGYPFSSDEAFLWRDGQRQLLGRIAGRFGAGSSEAWDVNNAGVVVGSVDMFDSSPLAPNVRGMIWSEQEGIRNLNDFLPSSSGLHIMYGFSINDHGQICGWGYFDDVDDAATFRLDPIPPKLIMQQSPTNLLVSFSPAWPGLVLESTPSLHAPDWQSVDTGGTNVLAVSATNTMRFFRLNLEGARGLCCAPE